MNRNNDAALAQDYYTLSVQVSRFLTAAAALAGAALFGRLALSFIVVYWNLPLARETWVAAMLAAGVALLVLYFGSRWALYGLFRAGHACARWLAPDKY